MDYRLELLDDAKFENLVNAICQKLLGMGVVSFAPGKDGGRDGKFIGTAQKYPDTTNPWSGKFIIQAKHTANPVASCSDSSFETIVNDEIKKIKELKASGDIDCYMLFTNRKYTGVVGESLLKKIITETSVSNCVILGKETINNQYLNPNRDLVKQFDLDKHHIPFDFSDDEIKDIILNFKSQLSVIEAELKAKVDAVKFDFDAIKIEEKNKKNDLGEEYYKNEILSRSLMDFEKIERFLQDPKNEDIKEVYFDIASELSSLITIKRDNFHSFEEVFVFIYQRVCDGDARLKGSKRHVYTLLHFMYFSCLVGLK